MNQRGVGGREATRVACRGAGAYEFNTGILGILLTFLSLLPRILRVTYLGIGLEVGFPFSFRHGVHTLDFKPMWEEKSQSATN